ncbi:ATP-grasp fold amidoligase family protein [uncultured Eudoraea sp.]|uniref:ATP-grasp fold amidoligase family protein n=1 Tax=uncultured Eudoraea sp. TaxID=1035614 RepID=UPI002617193D|nr:ATP-grasp fold amidoligase family protein [uncultured Eudoraea sp.]
MINFRKLIKNFYHKTQLGKVLISPYMFYRDYIMSDTTYVKRSFKREMGYNINLNNPITLNEKMQWSKLYNDNTALHTQCADKYAVREHVASKIGQEYLVPLYFTTKDPAQIVPDNLPKTPCIIKTNHDSSGGIIIKNLHNVNWKKIQKSLKERMSKNYYYISKEQQYKDIVPRIIVEKLLLDKQGNVPNDYKIHCFNGNPEFIGVDIDRFSNHTNNLYNIKWELLPFIWSVKDDDKKPRLANGREIQKPKNLNKLLTLAKALSEDFIYSRIDFYVVDEEIYFGEITFHHGGGVAHFIPKEWDTYYGNILKIPLNRNILPKKMHPVTY